MPFINIQDDDQIDNISAPIRNAIARIKHSILDPTDIMVIYNLHKSVIDAKYHPAISPEDKNKLDNTSDFLSEVMSELMHSYIMMPTNYINTQDDIVVAGVNRIIAVGSMTKLLFGDGGDKLITTEYSPKKIISGIPNNPFNILIRADGYKTIKHDNMTVMKFYKDDKYQYANKKHVERAIRIILLLEDKQYNKKNINKLKYYILDSNKDYPIFIVSTNYFAIVAPLEKIPLEEDLKSNKEKNNKEKNNDEKAKR